MKTVNKNVEVILADDWRIYYTFVMALMTGEIRCQYLPYYYLVTEQKTC